MVEANTVPEFGPCSAADPNLPEQDTCSGISTPTKKPKGTHCAKCKEAKGTLILKTDRVCHDCYQFNITHRFKNSLVRYCRI